MLSQITKLRLPSGVVVALVDWTDRPLFSTADFQTGFTDQETNIFNYLPGDPIPSRSPAATIIPRTATLKDTNLSTAASMASNEEMLVYAIKVEVFQYDIDDAGDFTDIDFLATRAAPNAVIAALKMLHMRMILQLWISQKVYSEAGLGYYNTGFGPWGNAVGPDNLGTVTVVNQGVPSQEAVRSFVIPHHIGGQEKYRVTLANPEGSALAFGLYEGLLSTDMVASLRVYFDGLYKRPVS